MILMSVSYYEIGGVIQESVTPSAQTAPSAVLHSSPIFLDAAKRLQTVSHAKRGTSSFMPSPKPGVKLARNLSRAGRAHRALVLAGTVAAADGPLPIGDAIAIGILTAYAGYETYRIIDDLS